VKGKGLLLAATIVALIRIDASATVRYVDVNSASPTAPYTDWTTAAATIQDAIDVADPGDQILVTNGMYSAGSGLLGSESNRVAVTKPMTLQSVNGPGATFIVGSQVPGVGPGTNAARCVALTNGSALIGFTLTNGGANRGAGIAGIGGGSLSSYMVSNCIISGNVARDGGAGAADCTLIQCKLINNAVVNSSVSSYLGGGGAYDCVLNDCIVVSNSISTTPGLGISGGGGGAASCKASNCTFINNSTSLGGGGGVLQSFLVNCSLVGNSSGFKGGGALSSRLRNCLVAGNTSPSGGGIGVCLATNCTIVGNFATSFAGGADGSGTIDGTGPYLDNCIIYFNNAPSNPNYNTNGIFNYCCTTPLPPYGVNNIVADPQLAGFYHLIANSPCRGTGNSVWATGLDIDGDPWNTPPSIGYDEYYANSVTGALTARITASRTECPIGYPVQFAADIQGRLTGLTWDFGDQTGQSNLLGTTHSWTVPGDYPVILRAFNESFPDGVSATQVMHIVERRVHYVSIASTNPVPPYSSWETAATVIQDAIDAAELTDLVLVTNGIYQTGGSVPGNTRVSLTKALTVQSVNGPEVTIIRGYQVPGTVNGTNSMRCVSMASGCTLTGFTLTNGATPGSTGYSYGGGVAGAGSGSVVSNCVIVGNVAARSGGGAIGCSLIRCTIENNQSLDTFSNQGGGGAYQCTLNDCIVRNNSAVSRGGGVNVCQVTNCFFSGNYTTNSSFPPTITGGGGAFGSTLINCELVNNRSSDGGGGGANQCALNNCLLTGNSAGTGGGAQFSRLNNCLVTYNLAGLGGGLAICYATNCTIVGNSARSSGGGASFNGSIGNVPPNLENCIVYFNQGGSDPNYTFNSGAGVLNYCCTTPLPTNGVNNFISDPQLTGFFRLSAASPCRGAGNPAWTTGLDIHGQPWLTPPSIGCDEYYATVTGSLTAQFTVAYPLVPILFSNTFVADVQGPLTDLIWDFGDGTQQSNLLFATHSWVTPGDYSVVLRAYNDDFPAGVSATQIVHVVENMIHYVSLTSTNPMSPYISWDTAATNIQDAIDVAYPTPHAIVLVDDGIYRSGGRKGPPANQTNRVTVDKPILVCSVNGPAATVIEGLWATNSSATRCAYLGNGSMLAGFTLTNGSYWQSAAFTLGGGVWCQTTNNSTLSNCLITASLSGVYQGTLNYCTLIGNTAGAANNSTLNHSLVSSNSSTGAGGGVSFCALNYCILSSNVASLGGGAYQSTLNNCLVIGNRAGNAGGTFVSNLTNCTVIANAAVGFGFGGGVSGGTFNNCIIYYNTASSGNNFGSGTLNYCCTTPMPVGGVGNITNVPGLVDPSVDFHLKSDSPCINSGNNLYVTTATDLDGNVRIVGGPVDIGAYEFQSPGSRISYAWLQQFGLPLDGSADDTDTDGDTASNWQEWKAGTAPNDPQSVLQLLVPVVSASDVTISWQSVSGRTYFIDRSASLSPSAFVSLKTNITGLAGTTSYTDTNVIGSGPFFYRVGVQQ
jgi:hypothetical protein